MIGASEENNLYICLLAVDVMSEKAGDYRISNDHSVQ